MLRTGVLLILVLVIGIPIVASRFLPWWGTLIVLLVEVALIVAFGPRLIGWGVMRIAMGLLEKKSRVLAGATIQIHEVKAIEPPAEAAAEEDQTSARDEHFVQVDCTITPPQNTGEMHFYEPGEFLLVPYEAPVSATEHPGEDEAATVFRASVVDSSGQEQPDPGKITGTNRLRLIFACPSSLRGRVKFRYYFEQLGELALP